MAVAIGPIDDVLRAVVESGQVPGVVATAADDSGMIYMGAYGSRSAGSDAAAMTADSIFRIASMTKMVTTVAALQQVEGGRLDLESPVASILPRFGELQVLDGFDADVPRLRPPASQATVRQLMTHTAGLGYWFFNADLARYEEVTAASNVLSGLEAAFEAPLVHDPGTRFEYGINTDWLGKVVEAVSGESLEKYFARHILEPLDMHDTTVRMTDEQRARSVPVHVRNADGTLSVTELNLAQDPEFWAGGHSLYSTAVDYLRFQRMLLGDGKLGDVRILEAATVDEAFRNQIGRLEVGPLITASPDFTLDVDLGPGQKWGLGLLLNTVEQPGMRAAGSGSWAGIFNSHFWIDRTNRLTAAIYLQLLPFFDPPAVQLYIDFERLLYASR